ncbi:hypothetical protein T310_10234, partial [Rasamsonia emersonii CBS 393.64]
AELVETVESLVLKLKLIIIAKKKRNQGTKKKTNLEGADCSIVEDHAAQGLERMLVVLPLEDRGMPAVPASHTVVGLSVTLMPQVRPHNLSVL